MIFEENLQYKHEVSGDEELPAEWKIILNWIGKNKTVLETGCHTGDFSRHLKENGCNVTGMEINTTALEVAKPFLENAILGDLEAIKTWEQLEEKKFDFILFEHVLEHLFDPWQILAYTKNYLVEGGCAIIALPNISNAETRFDTLFGKFDYTEIGVMDKTHLRFFNQKTAREMISTAGFKVADYASPWPINPLQKFLDHLPFFWRVAKRMKPHPPSFPKFSANLTDVVMLFKCEPKVTGNE